MVRRHVVNRYCYYYDYYFITVIVVDIRAVFGREITTLDTGAKPPKPPKHDRTRHVAERAAVVPCGVRVVLCTVRETRTISRTLALIIIIIIVVRVYCSCSVHAKSVPNTPLWTDVTVTETV